MSGRRGHVMADLGQGVRPDPIDAAYNREVTRLRRLGLGAYLGVLAIPAALIARLVWEDLPEGWGGAALLIGLASGVVGEIVARRLRPRRDAMKRAVAALNLTGQRVWVDEWNALGIGPAPASPRECLVKLAPVDESDVTMNLRALLHLGQGETDEVRAILAAWQPGDPLAAARKELIEIRLRLEAGQDPAFERAEELVAAIPAGEDRRVGEATLAIVRARAALAAGSPDWWRAFPAPPGPGGRPERGPITALLARRRRRP